VPRDTSATRARLMTAAREEFAAHGIAGARVDRIAEVAGVNKQRIYGLFGSKEALFDAVVVEAMDEHTAALGMPTDDAVEYVGRIYDFHRQNPQLLRLLMWEALYYDPEQRLPGEDHRTDHYVAKVQALAKATGVPPDSRAAAGLLVLIAMAMLPSMLPQLTRMVLDPYRDVPDDDVPVRGHLLDFARLAFASAPQPPHRRPRSVPQEMPMLDLDHSLGS
jgi:AcrR family transcriptional regulator